MALLKRSYRLSRQPCRNTERRMRRPISDSAINGGNGNGSGRGDEASEDEEAGVSLLDEAEAFSGIWSFTKTPFKSSLLASSTHEMEDVAARMFNSTLVYAGLETSGKTLQPNIYMHICYLNITIYHEIYIIYLTLLQFIKGLQVHLEIIYLL